MGIQNLTEVRIDKEAVLARKSTLRIGLETAARMKVQRKARAPKFKVFLMDPHDEMDFPSAPERGGPVEGF